MPTTFQFTNAQLEEIQGLYEVAKAKNPSAVGAYAPIYEYVYRTVIAGANVDIINDPHYALFLALTQPDELIRKSASWLIGGSAVNSATGAFSNVIRLYNKRQGELRGFTFTDAQLQEASNAVGENFVKQVLGIDQLDQSTRGYLPTVTEIGDNDLLGVRNILYPGNEVNGAELYLNQAWPGILMLGKLGENYSSRLLRTVNDGATEFDVLTDFKNCLFAWESFEYAFNNTHITNIDLAKDLAAGMGIANLSDIAGIPNIINAKWWFKTLLKGQDPTAYAVLSTVADFGAVETLDMLRRSIFGKDVTKSTDTTFAINARDLFSSLGDPQQLGMVDVTNARELANFVPNDFGSLVALDSLSLFRFTGPAATTMLSSRRTTLFQQWQDDAALTNKQRDQGLANFNKTYLDDRAIMLAWISDRALNETQGYSRTQGLYGYDFKQLSATSNGNDQVITVISNNAPTTNPRVQIIFGSEEADTIVGGDVSIGGNIYGGGDHLYGGGANDIIKGNGGGDYIEGNADDDQLFGSRGKDQLLGGEGNDTLDGGVDTDTLWGGKGNDTYLFRDGDGIDFIVDTAGQDKIKWGANADGSGGSFLTGGKETKVGSGVWVSDDEQFKYTLATESDGTKTLVIMHGSDRVFVKEFTSGDFGINLGNGQATTDPEAGRTIVGDLKPIDTDPAANGVQMAYDDIGNPLTNGSEDGRADYLKDSAGNDLILAKGGNDTIEAVQGGDDRIEAGGGRDIVRAGIGNDVVLGGSEGDILVGGLGDDRLYSNVELDVAVAISMGRTQSGTGNQGDWINGGRGDDIVIAGADNDALFGGGGRDVLVGGAGDDLIDGDDDYTATSLNWHVNANSQNPFDILVGPNSVDEDFQGDADVIYGGKGNDHINGVYGDDVLYGEEGDDVIAGDDNNDTLYGGDGNDRLTGDYGLSAYLSGAGSVVHGNDYIDGGNGNDWLQGEGGNDQLFGGSGDDTIWGDVTTYNDPSANGNDYLDGEDGNDILIGQGGNDQLFGGSGNDQLFGDHDETPEANQGNDYLDGGDGNDGLRGYGGNDELFGGSGDDELAGEKGDDYLDGEVGDDTLQGGEGKDILIGGEGNDLLFGDAGKDHLVGGLGDDVISGGSDDDEILGGAGADYMEGGEGNDSYLINLGETSSNGLADKISDNAGKNKIIFGAGILETALSFTDTVGGDIKLTLSSQESIFLANALAGAIDSFEFSDGHTVSGAELIGKKYETRIDINVAEDNRVVFAGLRDDSIVISGAGNFVSGGRGNDIISTGNKDTTALFNLGDGNDIIKGKGVDQFEFGDGILSSSLRLEYYSSYDYELSDYVNYYQLRYGDADDYIVFEDRQDVLDIQYKLYDGSTFSHRDLLEQSGIGLAWHGTAEADALIGTTRDDNLSGEDGDDLLDGGSGDDSLEGMSGADYLSGGNGNDILLGGEGNDQLYGGSGNDRIEGGDGNDILDAGTGNDILLGGMGDDVYNVSSSAGFSTIDDANGITTIVFDENINLAGISAKYNFRSDGNLYLSLQITADSSVDIRASFNGNINEPIIFKAFDGQIISQDSFVDSLSVPILYRGAPDKSLRISGTSFDDVMVGGNLNDRIMGAGGNDQLAGNAGDDYLEGGTGDDLLVGNIGNDILVGGLGSDRYYFERGMGIDTIWEEDTGTSILLLKSGFTAADLAAKRIGDDLSLQLKNGIEAVTIKGYYSSNQEWQIKDENNSSVSLSEILPSLPAPQEASQISERWSAFKYNLISNYGNSLQASGYIPNSDGSFTKTSVSESETYRYDYSWHTKIVNSTQILDDADITALPSYQSLGQTTQSSSTTQIVRRLIGSSQYYGATAYSGFEVVTGTIPPGYSGVSIPGGVYIPNFSNDVQRDPFSGSTYRFIVGYTVYSNPTYQNVSVTKNAFTSVTEQEFRLSEILAGNNDNLINVSGPSLVDGGGGDDTIIDSTNSAYYWLSPSGYKSLQNVGSFLYGNNGNDRIFGGSGDDSIVGGQGNDYLEGGSGADSYIVSTGDGNDVIVDFDYSAGGADLLILPDEATLAELTVDWIEVHSKGPERINGVVVYERTTTAYWMMKLSWGEAQSVSILLPHAYQTAGQGIEMFKFADGTTATFAQIAAINPHGSQDADELNNTIIDIGSISGRLGNDTLISTSSGRLFGDQGVDTLIGSGESDFLYGGSAQVGWGGGDQTTGSFWDEGGVYRGGGGNDVIYGTAGNDIYEYNLGDGFDVVTDQRHFGGYYYYGGYYFETAGNGRWTDPDAKTLEHQQQLQNGSDTLKLGFGITVTETAIKRNGDDLLVIAPSGGVSFENWFARKRNSYWDNNDPGVQLETQLNKIEFADGTIWTVFDDGTYASNDELFGASVNIDNIQGDARDNMIVGAKGNDFLSGGAGSDRYVFRLGDGQDTIIEYAEEGVDQLELGPGINAADTKLSRENMDLLLDFNSSDKVRIANYFLREFENISFFDGTVWDYPAVQGLIEYEQIGTAANDQLIGISDSKNRIYGLAGNDDINGANLNDFLSGGVGNDVISGLSGDDIYAFNVGDGHDIILEAIDEGNDVLRLGVGLVTSNTRFDREGMDLILDFNSVDEVRVKNYFLQTLESIQFDDGNGGESYWDYSSIVDKIRVNGSYGNDVITGLSGQSNWINGWEGDDQITGESQADVLEGSIGNDTLQGGQGDDLYVFNSGDGRDTLIESAGAGDDVLMLGEGLHAEETQASRDGTDLVLDFIDSDQVRLKNYFSGAWEIIKFADGTQWDQAFVATFFTPQATTGDDSLTGTVNDDEIHGLAGNDTIEGGAGNDLLFGEEGYDILRGGIGDDLLDGGSGTDAMTGGIGNDTYVVDVAGDIVIESGNEGADLVRSSITYTLGANLENLTLEGSTGINGTGNAGANIITGNSAANSLNGLGGIDTMIGGLGNDIYTVENTNDIVVEQAGEGNDTVKSSANYILSANVEALTLTGSGNINGTGNNLDNALIGTSGNNTLIGALGNDTLNGGAGADILIGGLGNDIYVVENAGDAVTEQVGEGIDLVQSSISYALTANVENLTLTGSATINGNGNELANVVTGNNAVNILFGGAGNDTLNGGSGADMLSAGADNDLYIVDNLGDVVTEYADEGLDTVQSSVSYALSVNVENLTLTTNAAINGTGNDLDNVLMGNGGINILYGNAGNDILNGGGGVDTMFGGTGNDYYWVENYNDVVTEYIDEGIDTVQTVLNNTSLGANIENMVLGGTTNLNGNGNELANTITGNIGNNILDGKAGADVMVGGAGSDIYIVDNVNDILLENSNDGIDQAKSSISYTLANNVEALLLTGTGIISGDGNSQDNLLIANNTGSALNGQAGNDILQGGTDTGADTLVDTQGNNLFHGLGGNDVMIGGAGNDIFMGGSGNDTITTGGGADIIAFNKFCGQDIVTASSGGDDTISLGKGIWYAALQFRKSNNDLILVTGSNDQITFQDWYADTGHHSVVNLQIDIEATPDYNAASTNVLNNKKINTFDFEGLVNQFDQARAVTPTLTNWALSSSLMNFHLASSDTEAIGGDLAYQYAKTGGLTGVSMIPAQSILSNSQFGINPQNLQATTSLADTSPRLGG